MGAWGAGPFENDGAGDFVWSVTDGGGLAAIEDAFDHVLEAGDEDVEAPASEEAIAAAAIVARLRNGAPLSDEIEVWIASDQPKATDTLSVKARHALQRVITPPSELLDLWQEADEFGAWKTGIDALLRRLG